MTDIVERLRWVIYRNDERLLQWCDSDGKWHDVREIDYQEARQEDRIAKEDRNDLRIRKSTDR